LELEIGDARLSAREIDVGLRAETIEDGKAQRRVERPIGEPAAVLTSLCGNVAARRTELLVELTKLIRESEAQRRKSLVAVVQRDAGRRQKIGAGDLDVLAPGARGHLRGADRRPICNEDGI